MGGLTLTALLNGSGAHPAGQSGLWRPPQWSSQPQLYSLTCTLPNQQGNQAIPATASGGSGAPTTFYFDGVMRFDINEEVYLTKHPVQNGASITDHAVALPIVAAGDVFFSDAMASFTPGQYSGNPSKSVAAYQQFQTIKNLRLPCTLTTRLSTYQNMIISQLRPAENYMTRYALRLSIRFEQIIVAQVTTQQQSTRPQSTDSTSDGTVTGNPVPLPMVGMSQPNASNQPQWNSNNF